MPDQNFDALARALLSPSSAPPGTTSMAPTAGPGEYLVNAADAFERGQLPPPEFLSIVRGVAEDLMRGGGQSRGEASDMERI